MIQSQRGSALKTPVLAKTQTYCPSSDRLRVSHSDGHTIRKQSISKHPSALQDSPDRKTGGKRAVSARNVSAATSAEPEGRRASTEKKGKKFRFVDAEIRFGSSEAEVLGLTQTCPGLFLALQFEA